MVERICPQCQHGNPPENQFCGHCGNALSRLLPVPVNEQALMIAGHQLPVTLRQVGQTVAISLVALAAEAGLSWLRGRIERGTASVLTNQLAPTSKAVQPAQPAGNITMIVSQRVLEIWEHGELTRKIVERSAWRRESS